MAPACCAAGRACATYAARSFKSSEVCNPWLYLYLVSDLCDLGLVCSTYSLPTYLGGCLSSWGPDRARLSGAADSRDAVAWPSGLEVAGRTRVEVVFQKENEVGGSGSRRGEERRGEVFAGARRLVTTVTIVWERNAVSLIWDMGLSCAEGRGRCGRRGCRGRGCTEDKGSERRWRGALLRSYDPTGPTDHKLLRRSNARTLDFGG